MDFNGGDNGTPARSHHNHHHQQPYGTTAADAMTVQRATTASSASSTTIISTVVVHRAPIKVVIALLQIGESFHIKVVELEPHLSFLGSNLDEAVLLQKQHDELMVKLESLPSPIDEFLRKVDQMIETRRPRAEILHDMETSMVRIWNDIEALMVRRKRIADVNSNFHEKLVTSQSKIDALELACRDTMIPMEVEPVEEFLHKFRALRTDVLASVMATLKDGKELLTMLREIASEGSVDSRPDYLISDAIQAIKQVERLLEELHDRRNALETAWQSRREQLEQCLRLAVLTKEVNETEARLDARQDAMQVGFSLGESQEQVEALLSENSHLKHDAIDLRDRALRLAKAAEQLVESGSFANEETCARAYALLAKCTDFYVGTDRREALLGQAKMFFVSAAAALAHVADLEAGLEDIRKLPPKETVRQFTHILEKVNEATAAPLQMGYCLIDEVGRTLPEVSGVKRKIDELEHRKECLEKLCTVHAEHEIKISEKLNHFFDRHNQILSWLIANAEEFIKANATLGTNLLSAQTFLQQHYKLLADLEAKGKDINDLLLSLTSVLESLDATQRMDVDTKVESLHKHWTQLKNIAKIRLELATLYIRFLDDSESLEKVFNEVELILRTNANEDSLKQIEKAWAVIKPSFAEIKMTGGRVVADLEKVADPYLDRQAVASTVAEILDRFSKRQFTITESCDNWSKIMTEKKEVEILWERTMSENVQTLNGTSKIDHDLYPILTIPSEVPEELKSFTQDRLAKVTKTIEEAKAELQKRIVSTSHLEPTDDETNRKLHQVIDNLQSIKAKLDTLSTNYESLIISMVSFFDAIIATKKRIDDYFEKGRDQETTPAGHEEFRQSTMEQFRSLISQSETIIQRIRDQEPDKAKEHDTDRIITLLERLRIMFESRSDSKKNELVEYNALNQFKVDIRDIHSTLDDLTKQLGDTNQLSSVEDHESISAKSRLFEYLEQTIELTRKRIDQFTSSSTNLGRDYHKLEPFITSELRSLNSRWQELQQTTRNNRVAIDSSVSYFKMLDEIKRQSRSHNDRLQDLTARAAFVNNGDEAKALIRQIDEYIDHHETNQLNALRRLSDASRDLFGFDKSVAVYSENITVFDTFLKTKAKLVEYVKEQEDKEREAKRLEELENQKNAQPPQEPPMFYQPLQDGKVQEGDRFVFKCAVRGTPTPNVEWFKDGISIQNNSDFQTTFNNGLCTLTIEETMLADTANFHCRATNPVGQDETLARLFVTENVAVDPQKAPEFLVSLTTGFAQEGSQFAFNCVVSGHPLPIVQWFRNNICIDELPEYTTTYNNGQATLRINEVCLDDQTSFTCRATNPAGSAETTGNLIVARNTNEKPVFLQPLTNVMARVGQKLKLECIVKGNPVPTLIWKQNKRPIFHADAQIHFDGQRGTLIIPEALLKDAGEYTVVAENEAGSVTSSCNVSVKGRIPNETSDSEFASDIEPIKPTVQMPLRDASVMEGKSIRLDCIIVGQPEPEVIWYHDGRPIKESPDVRLQFHGDRCSLLINEALPEDGGDYRVVAINSAGEISSQCQLTVLKPLSGSLQEEVIIPMNFTKLLSDCLVREGERFELEVSVVGTPTPQLVWVFNNRPLERDHRVQITNDGQGNHRLVIHQAHLSDGGLYTVRATNPSGEIKCFSHVIVKAVNLSEGFGTQAEPEEDQRFICPTFKELFSDKFVVEGSSTKFECIVIGKPVPRIKWLFNDQPIHGKEFLVSTSGDRQVLSIPEVNLSVTGKVSCIAENEVGKATCVAYLNIIQPKDQDQHMTLSPESQTFTQEHNTQSSLVTITKQTFMTTQHQHVDSVDNKMSQMQIYSSDALNTNGDKQVQEYRAVDDGISNVQEKSVINVIRPVSMDSLKASTRKDVAPRFVTPLTGKIVDQFTDVTLEAIVDGFPTPDISVLKNGLPLTASPECQIRMEHNKVTIVLSRVGIEAAGRYSCVAKNSAGTSTSVADVVVKKSTFPPVFGRRLQTQIVKTNERVVMDVEITGLPEPQIQWFKDDVPISPNHPRYKLQKNGNCHQLIIENALKTDAGKFSITASNPGGNAESIASFAVVDATPDRIVEVVKTVVFENPVDRTRKEVSTSSLMKNISMTSKQIKITEEPLLAPSDGKRTPTTPKMHKPEYRGSETESDFESRSMPKWRANESDSEPQFRPVVFVPSKRQEEPQPKFTPVTKTFETSSSSGNRSATYFKSVTSQPIHNTIETTNSMQMHEKSEHNQRVVNMQSTTKIMNFSNQLYGEPVPFPYSADHSSGQGEQTRHHLQPPPTPTKFIKGDFRESDYESEIDSAKIRPVWTPTPCDNGEPRYRKVDPPRNTRSASCPRSQGPAAPSPLEFDTQPPYQPANHTQTLDRMITKREQTQTSTMKHVQSKATEMSDQFKLKAQNFISNLETRNADQRPTLQTSVRANDPQVYRDGSRVSQYDMSRNQSYQPRPESVPVNFQQIHQTGAPKRPPVFITPLKEIAVVSGQTARFECIVQCENTPEITWMKDGRPLSCCPPKHLIEYRNGVCRLTVSQTTTADGGVYSCTASNHLGSVTTTANLLVPANKWGTR